MSAIRAVVSDLDGTLVDAEPLYHKSVDEVVGRFGKVYSWEVAKHVVGKPEHVGAELVVSMLDLPLTPQALLDERDKTLKEMLRTELRPMAGAVETMAALRAKGLRMAIATSSNAQYLELKKANNQALFALFDRVVCGDDPRVKAGKPAPDIFQIAAGDIGVPPAQCLAFEDSPAGCEAAAKAGMTVIALPHANMDHALFSHATEILSSLHDFDPAKYGL